MTWSKSWKPLVTSVAAWSLTGLSYSRYHDPHIKLVVRWGAQTPNKGAIGRAPWCRLGSRHITIIRLSRGLKQRVFLVQQDVNLLQKDHVTLRHRNVMPSWKLLCHMRVANDTEVTSWGHPVTRRTRLFGNWPYRYGTGNHRTNLIKMAGDQTSLTNCNDVKSNSWNVHAKFSLE